MQINQTIKTMIVVGINLLFIGGLVTSSINVKIVKASHDNNLIGVTTEVCGIQGFSTRTVMLTTQQYQEVEHLMENINERLRSGIKNKETVACIQDIVITLNKYQLLPKGMTLDQAQKVIAGIYEHTKAIALREKIFRNAFFINQSNSFCFIAGIIHDGSIIGPMKLVGGAIAFLGLIMKLNFIARLGLFLMSVSNFITVISPVSLLQLVIIKSGNITSVGLRGVRIFNISGETGEGIISGFSGLKIIRYDTGQVNLLGVALGIKV